MAAIPPAEDISLYSKLKLWLFDKKIIDKVNYRNREGGTTHLRRKNSHAEKSFAGQ